MKSVALDTDIGTDVDDLLALLTMFGDDAVVDAITTVYGDAELRARMVAAVYSRAGRDAPAIVAGAAAALSGRDVFWIGHEGAGMTGAERALALAPGDAAAVLAGVQEIIAIGPLTNVANAVGRTHGIEHIYAMCGGFPGPTPEHNILCDVDAADRVFRSGVPLTVIGVEQTNRVRLGPAFAERLPQTLLGEWARTDLETFWDFTGRSENAPNDSMAYLLRSRPELFHCERGVISLAPHPAPPGSLRFDRDADGPHRIVVDMEVDDVRDLIESLIVTGAGGRGRTDGR